MTTDKKEWIDISVTLKEGMVRWPGDRKLKIERAKKIADGEEVNVSGVSMCMHAGTHIDAPFHFFERGMTIDKIPIDAVIGKARVIQIHDKTSIKVKDLEKNQVCEGERLLFKTLNSSWCWNSDKFNRDFVYISKEAAQFLASMKILTVGIDYLSVGGYSDDGLEIHRILLDAGIWIIEGLNLSLLKEGEYDLICLPLKISGVEGAPARAVVK